MNKKDYRAIEVIPGNCTCPLSQLAGKRVLLTEVNQLLDQASFNPHCTCKFKHFADRRQGIERRNFATRTLNPFGIVRTMPYGRRTADIHNRSRDQSLLGLSASI